MREILFRGKAYDNKWAEGCLITVPKYDYYCILEDEDKVHPMDYPYLDETFGTFDGNTTPVNPETIGQFTGLLDKNGNKIFEGDIVRCYSVTVSGMEEEEFVSDIFWLDCMWMLHAGEHCDGMLCYYDMTCEWGSHVPEIEVIGNIFDNPELLER